MRRQLGLRPPAPGSGQANPVIPSSSAYSQLCPVRCKLATLHKRTVIEVEKSQQPCCTTWTRGHRPGPQGSPFPTLRRAGLDEVVEAQRHPSGDAKKAT